MKTGTKLSIAVTAIMTFAFGLVSLAVGWFMWALALNGFMGQQRAVDTSMMVFFVLGVAAVLVLTGLAVFSVHLLSGKRGWHPVGSAALSTVLFSIAIGVLHFIAVIFSALVAEQLRVK